jgi:DNA-binding transcriptional regulator LsrR (DeoR family)
LNLTFENPEKKLDIYLNDFKKSRIISQVLTYYYIEGKNQAQIAKLLKLSTTKVNLLIKEARERKLIDISLNLPFQNLNELANRLKALSDLDEAFIVPELSPNSESIVQTVARAGANLLLERLRDGDTICVGGGKTLYAIAEIIAPKRKYKVKVVPSVGDVQGRHYFGANHIAAKLARKLGGEAYQFHAPLFVDSEKDRIILHNMRQNKEVLDIARNAQIALYGVGIIRPEVKGHFNTIYDFVPEKQRQNIIENDGVIGEILAHPINSSGQLCKELKNLKIVGMTLDELKKIPVSISIVATKEKEIPIYSALAGNHLRILISDEATASGVVKLLEKKRR